MVTALTNCKFDIIAVTETWITISKQENFVKIDDYVFMSKNRQKTKGGGVAFYIKDEITHDRRHDIEKYDNSIEHIWIEVKGKNKNYLLSSRMLLSAKLSRDRKT